jgi:bifunctional non-homologous end joining protein LigD
LKLYSRRHNDFKKRFPPISDALAELKQSVILDGEIEGRPRFEWLVNRGPQNGTLIYYVFDLIKLGEIDLRGEPLRKRKGKLKRLLKNQPGLRRSRGA